MASRPRRPKLPRRQSLQRQILDTLLRIEALLQTPRTVEDRVAEIQAKLLEHGEFRWVRAHVHQHGSMFQLYDPTSTVRVEVLDSETSPCWRGVGADWIDAPSVNHALIAASQWFLKRLEER